MDLFRASLVLGLPLMALTFAMVWWSLYRGIVENTDNVKALSEEIEAFGKRRSKQKKKDRMNPLHHRWFSFGGGFYGLAALYTYVVIEFDEVLDFIGSLPDMVMRFDVGILVNFFVESIQNFITAIIWPLYWMKQAYSGRFWVWMLVAYVGYWIGLKLAQAVAVRQGLEIPESWLNRILRGEEEG